MKKPLSLIIALVATTALQGCLAAAVVTGAEAAKTMAQDRSVGDRIDDNGIALHINDAFIQTDAHLFANVSTTIFQGRVLLTGTVKVEQDRAKAEELVWKLKGVVEVINEIQTSQEDFIDYSKDVYLANAVRSKLLFTKNIKSSNYATRAVNSTIYLLGVAQDQQERANAIEVARRVGGVKEVISHVILASDPRRIKWANENK